MPSLIPTFDKTPEAKRLLTSLKEKPKLRRLWKGVDVPKTWVRRGPKFKEPFVDGDFIRHDLLLALNQQAKAKFRLSGFKVDTTSTWITMSPDSKFVRGFLSIADLTSFVGPLVRWLFRRYAEKRVRLVYGVFYKLSPMSFTLVGRQNTFGSFGKSRHQFRLKLVNKDRFILDPKNKAKKSDSEVLGFDDVISDITKGLRRYLEAMKVSFDDIGVESNDFGYSRVVAYGCKGPRLGIAGEGAYFYLKVHNPILSSIRMGSMTTYDLSVGSVNIEVMDPMLTFRSKPSLKKTRATI